jgi:hypothetical protein
MVCVYFGMQTTTMSRCGSVSTLVDAGDGMVWLQTTAPDGSVSKGDELELQCGVEQLAQIRRVNNLHTIAALYKTAFTMTSSDT